MQKKNCVLFKTMNITPTSSKIMTLQVQQTNASAPTKNATSATTQAINNDSSIQNSPLNSPNLVRTNLGDMSLKGEHLQQLSTNALPPYAPGSPPRHAKSDSPYELHCCSDCGDTFTLKSSLNFHLERRSVLIKFPCETCKSVCIFYNRCTLQSHIRSHTDKNETADISKAVVNPIPRVFMDGLQTEFVNTLDDELSSIEDIDITPPLDLLEFSLKEIEEGQIVGEGLKAGGTETPKVPVKCLDCNEEFEDAEARKEHLTNGEKVPVVVSQCNKCGMLCPSKCCLKAHQRIHLQVSPYICPECGDSPDAYWSNFQHHVKYKCFHQSRSVGYKCPVCKRVSSSNEALLKHMELHTEKYLKCEGCPRAYMSVNAFEAHAEVYHVAKSVNYNLIYKCSLCDIVFLQYDQMIGHRSAHLKEQACEYVFNCMQCGRSLESKMMLLEHIKTTHPKIYKHISSEEGNEIKLQQPTVCYKGTVECMLCNFVFHSQIAYNGHVARAHINVNQPCSYCYMIIGNRREMMIHGKKHLHKGNIVCLLCNNKKCQDEKILDVHLSKHTEKLKNCTFCPLCQEIMPSPDEALNHLREEHFLVSKTTSSPIHPAKNQSEFVTCHFCRAPFANDAELQDHLQTMHCGNQKRQLPMSEDYEQTLKRQRIEGNVCAKCDYQSSDRENFKKHLLTHKTNKNTFQCQECGLCFVVESALEKHLRILHKISDTKKYIEEEGTNFLPDYKKTTEVLSCDSLICNVCFTTFANETSLKTHMRSHGMAFIQANKTVSTG